MSCFAGLLGLDGAPAPAGRLEAMAGRLAGRSPDGMASRVEGPLALVHGSFWTTPEEVGELQPVDHPGSAVLLAADARIDNRAELIARLGGAAGLPDRGASDAHWILAAYRAWGEELCDRLIGDYAFALWDGSERRLILARDPIGLRQVYYARCGSQLVFGSSIGAVLAGLPAQPRLNRPLIEAFLRDSYRHWVCETIFEGVLRVPPGHLVRTTQGALELRQWWQAGDTYTGGCVSAGDWVEAFREVFDRAVSSRLRSSSRVAVLTGGGVDSAALAGSAYRQVGASGTEPLLLATLTFDSPSADELEYFDELAAWMEGCEAQRIAADDLPLSLEPQADEGQPLDEPEVYLLRSHTAALFAAAAGRGCRVVLAGEGGNQVMRHSFYYDASALRLVRLRELAGELPRFVNASQQTGIELLSRAFLWPLLPPGLKERLRRLRPDRRPWVVPAGPGSWRTRLPPPTLPRLSPDLPRAGRWAARSIGRPFDLARYAALDVTAAFSGVEWRLPYLDRRVVDLLLHAPRRLFSWRGDDRQILRRAMIGRMPERIRRRRSKSHIQEVLDRRLRRDDREAVGRLLDNPRAQALDCTNGSVAAAFAEYWNGTGTAYGLLSFLSLESWLRRSCGGGGLAHGTEATGDPC